MKVTITGGLGFIGHHFGQEFLKQGHTLQVIDNFSRAGTEVNFSNLKKAARPKQLIVARLDLARDQAALTEILEGQDAVIHLAAQVAVTTSIHNPRNDFESNALGTFNVLESIRKCSQRPSLLYASTNKVYGSLERLSNRETPTRYEFLDAPRGIDENCPLDFHSPYGCSKGTADQYVLDYARSFGLKTAVFRQSCIYGPGQFGIEDQGWAAWMAIAHLLGKEITVFGNGKQVRDLLHVRDLFGLYQTAIEKIDQISGQAFNVGGGQDNSRSLLEYLALLEKVTQKKVKHSFADKRPGDQAIFISDNGKAGRLLGWSPQIGLEEGLRGMLQWTQEQLPTIKELL